MRASNLLNEQQLEESYRLLIQFSKTIPEFRKTNAEQGNPEWTDRTGDYQKNLGTIGEIAEELLQDYTARLGKPELMKALFGRDL